MAVQNEPPSEATDGYLRPLITAYAHYPTGYFRQTSVDLFLSSALSNPNRWKAPGEGNCCGSRGAYFLLPRAAILFSGGLEGPARQDWGLRHRAAAKTRLEQRPMTEGPRRDAS